MSYLFCYQVQDLMLGVSDQIICTRVIYFLFLCGSAQTQLVHIMITVVNDVELFILRDKQCFTAEVLG